MSEGLLQKLHREDSERVAPWAEEQAHPGGGHTVDNYYLQFALYLHIRSTFLILPTFQMPSHPRRANFTATHLTQLPPRSEDEQTLHCSHCVKTKRPEGYKEMALLHSYLNKQSHLTELDSNIK